LIFLSARLLLSPIPDGVRAVDFTLDIERVPDPHGDRVKVTYNGKFLPYKKW
jgi:cyanate lyase